MMKVNESDNSNIYYIIMNKPEGYVCSAVSDSHKTVYELLTPDLQSLMKAKRGSRLHTVGRLDCDTSGLLLFTTDGDFSHKLTAPDCHVPKSYLVTLKASVEGFENQKKYMEYFSKPHLLPPEKKAPEQTASPAKLEFFSSSVCKVTINEGKFHQVRRMFLGIGNQVVKLHRLSVGEYVLDEGLKPGDYHFFDKYNALFYN